jgi:putative endonuclease
MNEGQAASQSPLRWQEGRIGWLAALLCRVMKPRIGAWGEWLALVYLRRSGWDIVARNWRGKRGELDLVAYDDPFLVFVEVKTRRAPSELPPEDQIGHEKERMLDLLADEFTLAYELFDCPIRIDVIAIETPDLRRYRLRHWVGWA